MPNKNDKKNNSSKNNFSIRKLIYNDKYLIIFSIFAAVVIWIATSISLSPQTTKTITVPLNVDFSNSAASQLGIKCYGDEKIDVDVTVSCKKYLAKDITAQDLTVTLQTNIVTNKGVFDVPIKVEGSENAEFNIQSYYPTHYSAYFDVEAEKDMDIELEYNTDDIVAEGYVKGEDLLSETKAKIVGPKSYVSRVDKLVADVNIPEKLTETQTIDVVVQPLDSSGDTVDYINIVTESSNPTLTIPVLKEMELDVAVSFTGMPSGFDKNLLNITYSSQKVNAGVLESAGITEANIGNIDFSKLKPGRNEFTFQVSNLESMVVLDNIKEIEVTVFVPTSFKTKQLDASLAEVTVINVPDGYEAKVKGLNQKKVVVVGTSSELDAEDLGVGMVVDLSASKDNITLGTSEHPANATLNNSKSCWIYGDYTALISITKK